MIDIKEFINKNREDIIKPVAVLLAICIIIPLALSVTNKVTVGRIAKLEQKNRNETMSHLIESDEFRNSKYKDKDTEFEYYIAYKDKKEVGRIYTTSAKGYGGEVSVMTAIDIYGEIKNIAILDVSGETPGLGQNASKEKFYSQYKGKRGNVKTVKSGANSELNQVNAITGATITSTAVNEAVNTATLRHKLSSSVDHTKTTEVSENEK